MGLRRIRIGLLLAAARPMAVITLPSEQQTIVLAMDVSISMRATDVKPTRLQAAQAAAASRGQAGQRARCGRGQRQQPQRPP